jgi:TFIIH basal transcription factor complex TTD-A subunit
MILKYDEERHDYIVEDLDDENHLVIKESQLQNLKVRLDQVLTAPYLGSYLRAITHGFGRTLTKRSCSWTNRNLNRVNNQLLCIAPETYT